MCPAKQVPGAAVSSARDVLRRRGERGDKQVDGFGEQFTAPTPQPVQLSAGAQGLTGERTAPGSSGDWRPPLPPWLGL